MALYTFENLKTNKKKEIQCSISEYDSLKDKMNKLGWVRCYESLNFVSDVGSTLSKTDDGWKDLLKGIKKGAGRRSTIHV